MNDPFTSSFSPLLGLPCWGVEKTQASILSFEFGNPRLHVREPISSTSELGSVRASLARRLVKPIGAWTLTIYGCRWQMLLHGKEEAHEESAAESIDAALREIAGQKLIGARLDTLQRATTLDFDLGARLTMQPFRDDQDEQWSLWMPDEQVLIYRADGCYNLSDGKSKPSDLAWPRLPGELLIYHVGIGASG